jgi:hypothetical protein
LSFDNVGGEALISNPLRGTQLKIERARKHFDDLIRSINSYVDDKSAYSIELEMDREKGVHTFRLRIHRAPPLEEWSLLIGDCLHNLRSALDHLFWALIRIKHPDGIIKNASKAKFPITRDAAYFNSWRKNLEDWLGPAVTKMIENMQPYQGLGPSRNGLLFLHQRDIEDKHKLLLPLLWITEEFQFKYKFCGSDFSPRVHREFHAPKPQGEAVLVTITVDPPDAIEELYYDLSLGVLFDTDPVAHLVVSSIHGLFEVVGWVLADFAPLFDSNIEGN